MNFANIEIQIVKMTESSGNIQYFLRAKKLDSKSVFDGILEYNCFQTKHGATSEKCIGDAVFGATYLLKFFDKKGSDLKFVNFNDDEMAIVNEQKRFWRINQ